MLQSQGLCRSLHIHTPEMWLHIRIFSYSLLLTSGDSTGLSAEGITGRVLLILTDAILLLVFAIMVATCALSLYRDGNHLSVHLAVQWNPA